MRKIFLQTLAILVLGSFAFAPIVSAQLLDPTPIPPPPPVVLPPPPPPPVTPPADTTAPVISGVATASVSDLAATIVWTTDELATSNFEYGTTQSYGTTPTLDVSALLVHSAVLTNLSAATTYYYCIHTTDLVGNNSSSCNSFATLAAVVAPPASDTTAPVISDIVKLNLSNTATEIAWVTNELASSQIEYGLTTSYGSETTLDTNLATVHSTALLGLTAGTPYHFRIKSTDLAGNMATSSDQTFTTSNSVSVSDTTSPTISGLANLSLGSSEATILWDTDELTVSTLEYGTTANYGSQASLSASALLAHTAILTGLSANTTYYYCIHATDLFSNTANSCNHSFTTAATSQVLDTTAPNIAEVDIAGISTSSATISWSTDEVANGEVEYGTTQALGIVSDFSSDFSLNHSEILSGLSPNTIYHYRVRSSDQIGNLTITSDNTFTTASLTPSALSLIETGSITTSSATISWNTNSALDSQVEYGVTENLGSQSLLNSGSTTSHSVTLTGLIPNTNYIFRVKSGSLVSTNYEFTTLGESIPVVAPANILSVSSSNVASVSATVSWTTDKATTAQVEYGLSTAYGQSSTLNSTMQTSHSMALSDLTPGTIYHYRVKSTDSATNITFSEDYTFTTPALPNQVAVAPSSISTLQIGGHDQNSVALTWQVASANSDAAAEYDIRYSTSPITDSNFVQATSAQSSLVLYGDLNPSGIERTYIVAGLNPSTTYYFALKSKFESTNYSAVSNVVSITTTTGASVNDETVTPGSQISSEVTASFGSGSGGNAQSSFEPTLIRAEPADGQIIFTWKNPNESNFVRTIVVRKEGSYPTSPSDGQIIYEGQSQTFTDTNVQNGKQYYYSVMSYNHSKTYSNPVRVSLSPKAGNKEVKFNESGTIVTALPVLHFTRTLKRGDKSIEIEHLQEILAIETNVFPAKSITGNFGPITFNALKKFQAKHGLPQTGIVDPVTQKKLNLVSQSETRLDIPTDYVVFGTDLRQGSSGEAVKDLQMYLTYEGSYTGKISGKFDAATKTAVQKFQKKYGVTPVSGLVLYKTRHRMQQLVGL